MLLAKLSYVYPVQNSPGKTQPEPWIRVDFLLCLDEQDL